RVETESRPGTGSVRQRDLGQLRRNISGQGIDAFEMVIASGGADDPTGEQGFEGDLDLTGIPPPVPAVAFGQIMVDDLGDVAGRFRPLCQRGEDGALQVPEGLPRLRVPLTVVVPPPFGTAA